MTLSIRIKEKYMIFAVIKDDIVTDIIVADENQKGELELAMDAALRDTSLEGLMIGDWLTGGVWTRNINGEQVILPLPTIDYEQYYNAMTEELFNG